MRRPLRCTHAEAAGRSRGRSRGQSRGRRPTPHSAEPQGGPVLEQKGAAGPANRAYGARGPLPPLQTHHRREYLLISLVRKGPYTRGGTRSPLIRLRFADVLGGGGGERRACKARPVSGSAVPYRKRARACDVPFGGSPGGEFRRSSGMRARACYTFRKCYS